MLYDQKYTCRDHLFTHTASHKDTAVGTENVKFGLHSIGHISTGLMSIARVSWPKQVFFLLVSFSICFFAVLRSWRPDSRSLLWTVDVEMCLLLELCDAFIWTAISESGNSNELILCSRGNTGSSFPVAVLMRASFIIALDGFLRLHLKKLSKFLKCSGLTDLHVLK